MVAKCIMTKHDLGRSTMTNEPKTTLCVSRAEQFTTSLHLSRQSKHDCKCETMLDLHVAQLALLLSWHVGMSAGMECKCSNTLTADSTLQYVVQKRQRS
jgi:hypothetical protein